MDSVDSETAALTSPQHPGSHHSLEDVGAAEGEFHLQHDHQPQPADDQPKEAPKPKPETTRTKQRKFAQQRSILKNSLEHTHEQEQEQELIEAKRQLILRRRRLFSHYRQYEQWRRRQFSYDPSYYRPNPLPIGQAACSDYISFGGGGGAGVGAGAFRRRRQYRRQYSCAERSREESRDSRESPPSRRFRHAPPSDDASHAEPHSNSQAERTSFEGSECGALAYQPLHYGSRNFHMLHEEQSTTIAERCTRSRINSAIFVSTEGKGFDSIEFLRRHGSQSVLCRKAKSAENITENDRKKSFSNKRRWRTDESAEAIDEQPKDGEDTEMELQHIGGTNESRTLSVLNSNTESQTTDLGFAGGRSAAVTTSNVVVGSISIEAPPAYMKGDTLSASNSSTELQQDLDHSYMRNQNITTASHDSTDTVEELILIPRERVLVHQRSSTSTNRSQSPTTISPQNSPKSLSLKGVKQKLNALPMVSVSGPSPPHDETNPTECL